MDVDTSKKNVEKERICKSLYLIHNYARQSAFFASLDIASSRHAAIHEGNLSLIVFRV